MVSADEGKGGVLFVVKGGGFPLSNLMTVGASELLGRSGKLATMDILVTAGALLGSALEAYLLEPLVEFAGMMALHAANESMRS
jgi:hypothetical protein